MIQERSSNVARDAQVIIAVILVGAALRFLGDVLTPLLLAVFLSVMVDGLAELIRRRAPGLPSGFHTLVAVVALAGAFGLCVIVIAARASGFVQTLSAAEPRNPPPPPIWPSASIPRSISAASPSPCRVSSPTPSMC
jgi:predicted PurR-regulated permease PerM